MGARTTKVIFFDAAGTLFHLPRGVGWHYREVAARHGLQLDETALQRTFGAAWKAMPVGPATREARPDDDRDWWRQLVGQVLAGCAVAPTEIDFNAYFDELYSEFTKPGVWELFAEVHDVLVQLRPHFRLGIISNFDGRLRHILAHLGIADFFSDMVISSEVGSDKPDAWIFESALHRSGVAPREALHVGDDPVHDWQGAAAAGLEVFRLDRPANDLRDLAQQLTIPSAS